MSAIIQTDQPLKNFVLQCLNQHPRDDGAFLRDLNCLVEKEGDEVYPVLLKLLTHLDFEQGEAKKKWQDIVAHHEKLNTCLGRPVSLQTAVCDYFSSVIRTFQIPKVVEMEVFEQTARSSHSDPLTDLFNRGYFDEALAGEINRCRRYGGEFSLLFLDIDNFKKLNDSLGHQAGDLALKRLARAIVSLKRIEDIACRYGGEEIVLILPQTSKIKGLIIAERIRQKIEEMQMEFEGRTFSITLSGGLSSFPLDAREAKDLVGNADKAMYSAKAKGKNNISVFYPDKRQFLRVDFFSEIRVKNLTPKRKIELSTKTKNLSYGGILFESKDPFNIGDDLSLHITLSPGKTMDLAGLVVRVEAFNSTYDIGVSFLELIGEVSHEISRYIADFLTSHSQQNPAP
ncbi:MAG: diguanylate cyclase [Nitrospinae bacterium]|nr:diguanylate cyclase [Nitrospinota bacterium]